MTHIIEPSRPLPEGTPTIMGCESTLDRLILGQYAADHAPSGSLHQDGVRRMYLRMFDNHGGSPLPRDWRTKTGLTA